MKKEEKDSVRKEVLDKALNKKKKLNEGDKMELKSGGVVESPLLFTYPVRTSFKSATLYQGIPFFSTAVVGCIKDW